MITSVRNPKVAAALRLKKRAFRERDRRFLVEGAQAAGEALADGDRLTTLFHSDGDPEVVALAAEAGVETIRVSDEVMHRLTSTVTPQGLVGVAPFLDVELGSLADVACVAVLHEVRDPGNAGTVLRSADAAGLDAVVFAGSSVDVYNPKTVRASAGSIFHLPVVRGVETRDAVEGLRTRGAAIYAMAADGEADLYELDLTRPTAFLFGNEARGLPADQAALADRSVRIPIPGAAESLNLAAAATVCLFEAARQRRTGRRADLETLIASAAHDIRSPLTAMKGFGYALATRWEQMTEEQRSLMLQGIVYDTDRLNAILHQLVDAARLAAGTLELYPEWVSVGTVVEQVAASAARDPDHPAVVWEGGEVHALVDPDRLRLALGAFVEGLVWWAHEGPIRIDGGLQRRRLRVRARREGPSIAADDAQKLFLPRAPGAGSGSKIGLYVAAGVAEAQGGQTRAEVTAEELRFILQVPQADAS